MPEPPLTPAKIDALFQEYLKILDTTGLREFFEPVQRRVTLSMHAAVFKPDRKVFVTALARLGVSVPLEDCLFITENGNHIRTARDEHHMSTLRFGSSVAGGFDDWVEAPSLIAGLVAGA